MYTINERLDICYTGDFNRLNQIEPLNKMELGALCLRGINPATFTNDPEILFTCLQYALLLEQFEIADAILATGIDWRANNHQIIKMLAGERQYHTIAGLVDLEDLDVLEEYPKKRVTSIIKGIRRACCEFD